MNENKSLLHAIKAAKIHKEITAELHKNKIIQPGKSLLEIADTIENLILKKSNFEEVKPLERGLAFPCSLSVNEIVAHYTPNGVHDNYILKKNDIVKVDFGVHEQGTIIDSAFTAHFDEKYDEFIKISKDTTNYAVSLCGPDVVLGDIGKDIEEYIQSKEFTLDGKVHNLKTIGELSGHNLDKYIIHNSKAVPNIAIHYPVRMNSGEFFAVEPFVTTGSGQINYNEPTELFMINRKKISSNVNTTLNLCSKLTDDELYLYVALEERYKTLCFCLRWIKKDFTQNYNIMRTYKKVLESLVKKEYVLSFPAIYDQKENLSSQFEHTIYIRDKGILNLTKNNYY